MLRFMVQANMDHWDDDAANDSQQSLERCKLVEAMLQVPMTRGYVTLVATERSWKLVMFPKMQLSDMALNGKHHARLFGQGALVRVDWKQGVCSH